MQLIRAFTQRLGEWDRRRIQLELSGCDAAGEPDRAHAAAPMASVHAPRAPGAQRPVYVRLSIGIEHVEDIKEDIEQALRTASS